MYLFERKFKAAARKKAAKEGAAMKDGSFPIYNKKDLKNAIKLAGHSKHGKAAAMAHIRNRAKALGLSLHENLVNIIASFINEGKPDPKTGYEGPDPKNPTTTLSQPEAEDLHRRLFARQQAERQPQPVQEPVEQHTVTFTGRDQDGRTYQKHGIANSLQHAMELRALARKHPDHQSVIITAPDGKVIRDPLSRPQVRRTTVARGFGESIEKLDEHIENLVLNILQEADIFDPKAVLGLFDKTYKPKPTQELLIKPSGEESIFDKMKKAEETRKKKGTPPAPPSAPIAPLKDKD